MKYIAGIMLLVLVFLSVTASAQNMNYSRKRVTLAQLFKELNHQTGYSVVWNEKKVNADQTLAVDFHNASPETVMRIALARFSLTYTILGNMILVKEKEPAEDVPVPKPVAGEPALIPPVALQEVEIVSTGYQQIPRIRATGSFVKADIFQYNRKVSSDVFSRLEGITSGLLFNKNTVRSSAINDLDLSVRSRGTIFANDQPLIILDNFPFTGDFNALNPNDIEDITVLKDAASAAIWGVRAGNGVIVINTKRGKMGQPLKVSLNTNFTVSDKPDLFYNPSYLSSSDYIYLEKFLFDHGKYDPVFDDRDKYPPLSPVIEILNKQRKNELSVQEAERQLDILRANDVRREELKYYYRRSSAQQYAVSLSGSSKWSDHYFSIGYDKNLSEIKHNSNDRITISSQNTVRLLKNLELEGGLYYVNSKLVGDSSLYGVANALMPYYQFRNADGSAAIFDRGSNLSYRQDALSRGFLDWFYRPLDEFGKSPSIISTNNMRLSGGLKYTIVPGLDAALKYQYQSIDEDNNQYNSPDSYAARDLVNRFSILTNDQVSGYHVPPGGFFIKRANNVEGNYMRGQLNYHYDSGNHLVSAIAGYELSELTAKSSRKFSYGYRNRNDNSIDVDTTTIFNTNPSGNDKIPNGSVLFDNLERIRSVYFNAAYTYDEKYTISGSARIDGSNYFGVKTNKKNVPLWSAGLLWNVDKETFYKLEWLPVLKVRASYGYNGNLDRNISGIITFKYTGSQTSGLPYGEIISPGNPELRWERIGITNFGMEFGTKNQAISGKVEYYIKKGDDILGDKDFASSTGIKTLRGNYAKLEGSGFDILLNAQNIRGRFSWSMSLLFSSVKDKVSFYDAMIQNSSNIVGSYNYLPVVGKPVYGIYSYKWAGLDPANGDPRGYLNGAVSKDYQTIVLSTKFDDLEYAGPARPALFGGLLNNFSFDRFTLGLNISYKLGYYFRKPSVKYYNLYNMNLAGSVHRDFESRWQKPGDEVFTDVPSMASYGANNFRDLLYNNSSATVAKGDHIRLQDIRLGFDLDRSLWKAMPVKNLQLYIYTTNLGILWKANKFDLDPDMIGEVTTSYPIPKSFSIGLKANL